MTGVPSPEVRRFLDVLSSNFPPLGTEIVDADEARRRLAGAPRREPQPVAHVEDIMIAPIVGNDVPVMRVRAYFPGPGDGLVPAVVFFHGGGFVLCDLDTHDAICRDVALRCRAAVFSVEYRRAPEDPYPAAVDDAYAATVWVASHASELGVDPARISVAGDSAGGNLAAAVALMARDRGGPALGAQILFYPMLDPAQDSASYALYAVDHFVTAAHLRWYWDCYRGPESPSGADPYFAPPAGHTLAGLPPALVVVAGCDPLHDEGRAYAQRLVAEGVKVCLLDYPGLFHGFLGFADQLVEVSVAVDELMALMRDFVRAGR